MRRAEAGTRGGKEPPQPASPPGRAAAGWVLYGRSYCHLCEEMLAALRAQLGSDFPITVVDVDEDPDLARRYGELVPLLMCGQTEICRYRHNAEKVAAFVTQSR